MSKPGEQTGVCKKCGQPKEESRPASIYCRKCDNVNQHLEAPVPSAAPVVTEPTDVLCGWCGLGPLIHYGKELFCEASRTGHTYTVPDAVVTHEPNCGCPPCAPWEPDAVVSQPEGTRELPDDHIKHVKAFLLEMYQTMVGPVEEFQGNGIAELCQLLLKRAREDREKQAWIPVEERLPKDCQVVLVTDSTYRDYDLATKVAEYEDQPLHTTRRFRLQGTIHTVGNVTHWQPLPAPSSLPKAGETVRCLDCGSDTPRIRFCGNHSGRFHYPSYCSNVFHKSAAPPLLPAQDSDSND